MGANPGLKSRFSEKLRFPDFTPDDAVKLLKKELDGNGLELDSSALQSLPRLMREVGAGWGAAEACGGGAWQPSLATRRLDHTCASDRCASDRCASDRPLLLACPCCTPHPMRAARGCARLVQRPRRGHLVQAHLPRVGDAHCRGG
jgi:hypothetical protein